ncbi:MAG: hypothetical protein ABJF72_10710, partial [Balneola sp.]
VPPVTVAVVPVPPPAGVKVTVLSLEVASKPTPYIMMDVPGAPLRGWVCVTVKLCANIALVQKMVSSKLSK